MEEIQESSFLFCFVLILASCSCLFQGKIIVVDEARLDKKHNAEHLFCVYYRKIFPLTPSLYKQLVFTNMEV